MSKIRHPELAPEGRRRIDWVSRHMPVLRGLQEKYSASRPFQGLNMAVCIHLEAKTAYMASLSAVRRLGSRYRHNPLSAGCHSRGPGGAGIRSSPGATAEEYNDHIRSTLTRPPLNYRRRGRPDHYAAPGAGGPATADQRRAEETTTGFAACGPWPPRCSPFR